MFVGPSGCTIPQSILCEDCRLASKIISNTGEPPGHNNAEMGVSPADESNHSHAERGNGRPVRDILQVDVPNQAQSLVQN